MKKEKGRQGNGLKALLPLAVIMLILLFAFLVRARAYSLPATAKDEKQYMQDKSFRTGSMVCWQITILPCRSLIKWKKRWKMRN